LDLACARLARLIERVLERPLVDGEQEIALLDDLPVLEMHAIEIAGHARSHFHGIDGGKAADIFVEISDRALDRLGDGDRRWRRCAGRFLLLAATCDQNCERAQRNNAVTATYQ
jgi:hypothetical protein